jgi:SOS-response transcriptional repressor LexA
MIEGIKERFASIRKEQGLNVKEFAESLDMEPTTLSSIETGKREPSKEVLFNLAIKYAYSLNWIFTGLGERRLSKAVLPEQKKPPLLENLEKLIDARTDRYGYAISNMEARLTAIENKFAIRADFPENISSGEPKAEYPPETETGASYTAEPDQEYGEEETALIIAFHENVAAGPPVGQSDDEGWEVAVPRRFITTKPEDYYVLQVRGNSMIDAFIPDGSVVLIRWSDVPRDGAIQVVRIDDRVTLKRMKEGEDHSWTLCYEDGTGRTIPLGDENRVQGDFVTVLPPSTRPRMRGE